MAQRRHLLRCGQTFLHLAFAFFVVFHFCTQVYIGSSHRQQRHLQQRPNNDCWLISRRNWKESKNGSDCFVEATEEEQDTWLDAIASVQNAQLTRNEVSKIARRLSIVHPSSWTDKSIVAAKKVRSAEVMHASWTPGERFYGILDRTVPENEGGRTVQGTWPNTISDLIYIALLKNGHTHLMNTVGDLRQRLNGTSTLYKGAKIEPVMRNAHLRQQNSTLPGQIVFAVVRDPIERFLSSTCQDMSMSAGVLKKFQTECFANKSEVTGHDLVGCATTRLRQGHFLTHQHPQVSQIRKALNGVDMGVTLISQEEAFASLLHELGGQNHKVRDRTSERVYQKSEYLKLFCGLSSANLTGTQIADICNIYMGDVRMMEYAGIDVPRCQQATPQ